MGRELANAQGLHALQFQRPLTTGSTYPGQVLESLGRFRNLAVFIVVLLLMRRFLGFQISIVGSVVLTIVVSLIVSKFDATRR